MQNHEVKAQRSHHDATDSHKFASIKI